MVQMLGIIWVLLFFLMSEITELSTLIQTINNQMEQLSSFINQFHELVVSKQLTVTSDALGALMVDAPVSLPDNEASLVGKRITILDNLINTRRDSLKESIHKGLGIYSEIKTVNPTFNSVILTKLNELHDISSKYIH
jgi:hypothetical protein